jgi:hypothetical protein
MNVGESLPILIEVNNKKYKLTVEKIYHSEKIERYKVSAGGKEIILRNDRPERLKKDQFACKWKVESGVYPVDVIEMITREIESYWKAIYRKENPYVHPKNAESHYNKKNP